MTVLALDADSGDLQAKESCSVRMSVRRDDDERKKSEDKESERRTYLRFDPFRLGTLFF